MQETYIKHASIELRRKMYLMIVSSKPIEV